MQSNIAKLKTLGIDFGTKNIGLALSSDGKTALPFKTIEAKEAVSELQSIVAENKIEQIVLSLPLTMSGEIGPKAQAVQKFAEELDNALGHAELVSASNLGETLKQVPSGVVKIVFEDERLSTKSVAGFAKQKGSGLDGHQLAAREILQSYLDKAQSSKP